MTTAARFGSTEAELAQRTISFPQCWISCVKMGERLADGAELLMEDIAAGAICSGEFMEKAVGGVGLSSGSAAVGVGVLRARIVNKPAITRAASGGST